MKFQNYFRNKKILITGGVGFLGSNLAHRLVQLGARVTIVDSFLKLHGGNRFNMADISKNIRWFKGDIRNSTLMEKLVKSQDTLYNIAAQTSHTDSIDRPFLDVDINTRGQITILEACKKYNPSVRIIYCSTRAVYGSLSTKVAHEDALPNPLDIYSADKLAGENYHKIYHKVHGLNTAILRVANVYGPRAQMKQPSFGILNWFIRLAIDNQEIKIFGDGRQIRDYAYIDDVIDAFLITGMQKDGAGEIYNVGSGKGTPLIEIVKKIVSLSGKGEIVYVPWPKKNLKIDVGDFIADVQKIKKHFHWHPKIPLNIGLKQTISFYEKYKRYYW